MPDNDVSPAGFKRIPETAGSEDIAAADSNATKEAAEVASGKYEENEGARADQLRRHVHLAMLIATWFVACLVLLALASVAWHYLAPEKYAWLSSSQLSTIQTVLFSGAATGFGGRYFSSRIFGLR